MDSCCVPGAIRFCKNVAPQALDTCEGARFSCYIGPDMVMVPCSFDQEKIYGVDLRTMTIEEGWNSPEFDRFRSIMQKACPDCQKRELCMGGCPLCPQIVLCDDKNSK
jgi:radical SAM protein with 4Fe4S-binding SPASM domain